MSKKNTNVAALAALIAAKPRGKNAAKGPVATLPTPPVKAVTIDGATVEFYVPFNASESDQSGTWGWLGTGQRRRAVKCRTVGDALVAVGDYAVNTDGVADVRGVKVNISGQRQDYMSLATLVTVLQNAEPFAAAVTAALAPKAKTAK